LGNLDVDGKVLSKRIFGHRNEISDCELTWNGLQQCV